MASETQMKIKVKAQHVWKVERTVYTTCMRLNVVQSTLFGKCVQNHPVVGVSQYHDGRKMFRVLWRNTTPVFISY